MYFNLVYCKLLHTEIYKCIGSQIINVSIIQCISSLRDNIGPYSTMHTRVIQKVVSLLQKESAKEDKFSLFFFKIPLDINALRPKTINYCNPITDEGGILVLPKVLDSTNDLIIVSEMATTMVGFTSRKQEEVILRVRRYGVAIQSYSWLL